MTASRTSFALFTALKQNGVTFMTRELTVVLVGMRSAKMFKASGIA